MGADVGRREEFPGFQFRNPFFFFKDHISYNYLSEEGELYLGQGVWQQGGGEIRMTGEIC